LLLLLLLLAALQLLLQASVELLFDFIVADRKLG
jgi:hypothetical protein